MTFALPNAARSIDAVIFDMDGLLVDTEPIWRRVDHGVFSDLGYDITPYTGRGHTKGMRVDETVRHLSDCVGGGIDIDKTVDVIVEKVIEGVWCEATLLPGALAAIGVCERAGLKVALASGSVNAIIAAVLDRFELRGRFAAVTSAEDDLYGKPHPAIFLRTADILGVAPSRCVVVEDSINGCISARSAKMKLIAVPDARSIDDQRFQIADVRLSSLEEFAGPAVSELVGLALS